MKICRTESFDVQHFQKRHGSTGRMTHPKRRSKEFGHVLEETLEEQEVQEEFRLLLPRHGHFWDNGYEDKA